MLRRKVVRDARLLDLTATCRDCGGPLRPVGTMHRTEHVGWHVDFECPECFPEEEFGLWMPAFQPVIDAVLVGLDVDSIPWTELAGL